MKKLLILVLLALTTGAGAATFPPGFVGGTVVSGECVVASQTITAISGANPAVVSVATHNLKTGDVVYITNGDMNQLPEGFYTITKVNANSFSIPICTLGMVATTAVNTTTETVTITAHGWKDAQTVVYQNGGGTSIGGLTHGATYYIRNPTANTFQLSATDNGDIINLTGTGNSSQYFAFTGYSSGGTATTGYLAFSGSPQYISLQNGSVAHASAGPVYLAYSSTSRPDAPTITDPSTCDFLDPAQPADVPASTKYISMSVAAGQKAWVRYRVIY